ncbi:MAG: ribosome biogenesis GTPase Der [Coriobacteriia bacterium]|nr:ribosome biogenesis GTPase Der [Coriobacteriia bacterium]
MPLPIVAVVGRPNVGKSTLVNRIAQTADAIVHEARGVTRDRSYHRADWNGRDFMLIDTGGIEPAKNGPFAASVTTQALMATEEADIIVMLVDGQAGIAPDDQEVAKLLKRSKKPVFLLVNKVDDPAREEAVHDFWPLGLGEPLAVSALHGHNTGDILDAVVAKLPEETPVEETEAVGVAIIGRPNSGKSSLLNRLAGVERAIVSDVPGTTRDALDVLVERDEQAYRFVDTAGIRRKSQIDEDVEYYGFVRAMRAIDHADIALLVIDTAIGVTDGDQRIARFTHERGSGLIVLLNKWDLVDSDEMREDIEYQLQSRLGFVGYAPVLRISALTGAKVHRIFDALEVVYGNHRRHVTTSALNRLLTDMREFGHTISKQGKVLRLQYVTQTRTEPPGFTFFANHPRLVDDSYRRYIENRMREAFDFTGTPVFLKFRNKD